MIRLQRRHEPVHIAASSSVITAVNGVEEVDIADSLQLASSSSWAGPSQTRSTIVAKPSRLAVSYVPGDSPMLFSDKMSVGGGSVEHGDSGIDESSSFCFEDGSKGKGKARAHSSVRIVPVEPTPLTGNNSGDKNCATSEGGLEGSKHATITSAVASKVPRWSSALLRELRKQGFGFVIVILMGNIAVVVCTFQLFIIFAYD